MRVSEQVFRSFVYSRSAFCPLSVRTGKFSDAKAFQFDKKFVVESTTANLADKGVFAAVNVREIIYSSDNSKVRIERITCAMLAAKAIGKD